MSTVLVNSSLNKVVRIQGKAIVVNSNCIRRILTPAKTIRVCANNTVKIVKVAAESKIIKVNSQSIKVIKARGAKGTPGTDGDPPPYRSATITRDGNDFISQVSYSGGDVDITRDGNNFISTLVDNTYSPAQTLTFSRDVNNLISSVAVT